MTEGDQTEVDVVAMLGSYRETTSWAMERLLRRERHNRWLDPLLADYPGRGGKALRAGIMLATCEAYGGGEVDAVDLAAGLELLHSAFLIHDDIEDGSELRRGAPTLHRRHGLPLAINAGDGLALLATLSLMGGDRHSPRLNRLLGDELRHMVLTTIDGQATELGWRRDAVVDLTPDDYLDMIGRKTCWYTTIYPLRIGATIGSAGTASVERLNRFGFYLGAAFQIRDDLLNLYGSEARYGKELLGDIREGKRTLMVIHLLANADGDDRSWVVDFLAEPLDSRTEGDVRRVLALMEAHGSISYAEEFGRGIAKAAVRTFDEAFVDVPDSRPRRFLRDLVHYMLDREE